MSFITKLWKDKPSHETPINAAALIDMEQRLSEYSDAVGDNTLEVVQNRNSSIPRSVASRCAVNLQAGFDAAGLVAGQTFVRDHLCLADCDSVRIAFANSSNGTNSNTNAIFVRASIERPDKTPYQVTFMGGATELALPAGFPDIVYSDPVPLPLLRGDRFRTRTFIRTTNAGENVPRGYTVNGLPYRDGIAAGDVTMTVNPTLTSSGAFQYGPAAVLAETQSSRSVIGLMGDSITAGQGDSTPNLDRLGWGLRAIADRRPYAMLAVPGDLTVSIAYGRRPRTRLENGCTHIVALYGTNDLGLALSTAAQQEALMRMWVASAVRGAKVFACTIPPSTTSTDSFATLANQTVKSGEARRVTINDWIRDGAPLNTTTRLAVAVGTEVALRIGDYGHPLTGYFDTADAVESSRNSGKWRVDTVSTADGTHPNAVGHAFMAGAVDEEALDIDGIATPTPTPGGPPVLGPLDIFGASVEGYWKASDLGPLTDGTRISAGWPDTSGKGRHLTVGPDPLAPRFYNNVIFAKAVVRFIFDATPANREALQRVAGIFGSAIAAPWEFHVVLKFANVNSGPVRYVIQSGGGGTPIAGFGAGYPTTPVRFDGTGTLSSGNQGDHIDAFRDWRFCMDGSNSLVSRNGVTVLSGDPGNKSITALLVANIDVDIAEMFVISRRATAAELTNLHIYNQQTYGVS